MLGRVGANVEIILVDDDEKFAQRFIKFLFAYHIRTKWLSSVDELLVTVGQYRPSLILMSELVGGCLTVDLLPHLRQACTAGLILLSSRTDLNDIVVALEKGADGYFLKHDPPRELLARLAAVARRTARMHCSPAVSSATGSPVWKVDSFMKNIIAPDGSNVELSPSEFNILHYLMLNLGKVIDRDVLSSFIVTRGGSQNARSIDVLISHIRASLRPHAPDAVVIRSLRRRGYVLNSHSMANWVDIWKESSVPGNFETF